MKKPIKLCLFNLAFIVLAVLCISKRGLGLSFNATTPLKFALTISISIIGLGVFFYGNYMLLTQKEKIDINLSKLNTNEECIIALNKCKKTDPLFIGEIQRAIEQLESLARKQNALKTLLEFNGVTESFNYLNNTAQEVNFAVFSNVKSIINRLIAFDSDDYDSESRSAPQRETIRKILEENQCILNEYSDMLDAVSQIGDRQISSDDIKDMTQALRKVIKGKTFSSPDDNSNS